MAKLPLLYILDGSYYIYRGFYAVRDLKNSKGFPTNALFSFTSTLLRIMKMNKPEYLAIAFDPRGNTFRNEIYTEYKANRSATPEDLVPQLPYFRDIVRALNIPVLEVPNYEADDVIGTMVRRGERDGMRVRILSGDKDLLQLLDEHTEMHDSMRDKTFRVSDVLERFRVPPRLVPDVLGLAGDSSDNIPGVPGIGEKTAGKLIEEFGSMENLLQNIDKVSGKKRKENLAQFADQARLSKDLATIRTSVEMEVSVEGLRLTRPNFEAFDALCEELEMRRFPRELRALFPNADATAHAAVDTAVVPNTVCESAAGLPGLVRDIAATDFLSVVPLLADENTPLDTRWIGVAIGLRDRSVYVPMGHSDLSSLGQATPAQVWSAIGPALVGKQLITNNTKALRHALTQFSVELPNSAFDVGIAAYLLFPNDTDFDVLKTAARLGLRQTSRPTKRKSSTAKSPPVEAFSVEQGRDFAAERAGLARLLYPVLRGQLAQSEMAAIMDDIETPLSRILTGMEAAGIGVDTAFLASLSTELTARSKIVETRIYELAGETFTIQSPKQLAAILFDKLGLRVVKKGKSGPSTDQTVLEALWDEHPICAEVSTYRQLSKLRSTYIDALPRLVRKDTGRVHTTFNQTAAATGRLSSLNPNLQNIPIRTDEGRRIRHAFVARDGWTFVAADYSQIELRLLAHFSGEQVLIDAFVAGEDIHRRTAAEVLEIGVDEVDSAQRAAAKAINFGLMYGMGAQRLARQTGLTRDEAKAYIDRYFDRLPGLRPYFDGLVAAATEHGYAETLTGRRRPLPELNSGANRRESALGARLAVNTPIQGTAADLIKIAMIRVDEALRLGGYRSRMLLQVHDELLLECPDEEAAAVCELMRTAMQNVWKLRVPLTVEAHSAKRWDELK